VGFRRDGLSRADRGGARLIRSWSWFHRSRRTRARAANTKDGAIGLVPSDWLTTVWAREYGIGFGYRWLGAVVGGRSGRRESIARRMRTFQTWLLTGIGTDGRHSAGPGRTGVHRWRLRRLIPRQHPRRGCHGDATGRGPPSRTTARCRSSSAIHFPRREGAGSRALRLRRFIPECDALVTPAHASQYRSRSTGVSNEIIGRPRTIRFPRHARRVPTPASRATGAGLGAAVGWEEVWGWRPLLPRRWA